MAAEGFACEEVQGDGFSDSSTSSCIGTQEEEAQTVEESGAVEQTAASLSAGGGESGPLLVWDSSVIGGSASS